MATRVRVKLNRKNVRALLRSTEVRQDLYHRARRVAAAAGDGMYSEAEIGRNRARAEVRTGTAAARRREATSKVLLRALESARS